MHAVLAEVGDRACVLDAQAHLEGFYREFGFEPTGPVHDEDGIPHVAMRRGEPVGGRHADGVPVRARNPPLRDTSAERGTSKGGLQMTEDPTRATPLDPDRPGHGNVGPGGPARRSRHPPRPAGGARRAREPATVRTCGPSAVRRRSRRPCRCPAPAVQRVERTRTGGLWAGLILSAIVLLFLLVFILQNLDPVQINFLGCAGSLPVGVAMLLSAIAGLLLVAIPGGAAHLQLRRVGERSRRSATTPLNTQYGSPGAAGRCARSASRHAARRRRLPPPPPPAGAACSASRSTGPEAVVAAARGRRRTRLRGGSAPAAATSARPTACGRR